jgi:hypothetical protein
MNHKIILTITNFLCLIFLLGCWGTSYFKLNNYREVNYIHPDLLSNPIQTPATTTTPIKRVQDGYEYTITPIYNYTINALIVHQLQYFSTIFHKTDNIFPVDLCLIWGQNAQSKIYKSPNLNFSQDDRACRISFLSNVPVQLTQFSNNHLLLEDPALGKIVKKLKVGDQVKISGHLINVRGASQTANYGYQKIVSWNTSSRRDDIGDNACEVILVKDIKILARGNLFYYYLSQTAAFGLLVWLIVNIIYLGYKKLSHLIPDD